MARSTYYYARSHPPRPTRPELREKVAEVFSRTNNGCGHRQIAMALRGELGVRVADKTVLKMMREMGISCGIRRETDYHRYNSYKGVVGKTFENVIGRDFEAELPWQKMGTDVTEFKQPWGKAYFAPIYDFCSKEIVAWSVSRSPNRAQQEELLELLEEELLGPDVVERRACVRTMLERLDQSFQATPVPRSLWGWVEMMTLSRYFRCLSQYSIWLAYTWGMLISTVTGRLMIIGRSGVGCIMSSTALHTSTA